MFQVIQIWISILKCYDKTNAKFIYLDRVLIRKYIGSVPTPTSTKGEIGVRKRENMKTHAYELETLYLPADSLLMLLGNDCSILGNLMIISVSRKWLKSNCTPRVFDDC